MLDTGCHSDHGRLWAFVTLSISPVSPRDKGVRGMHCEDRRPRLRLYIEVVLRMADEWHRKILAPEASPAPAHGRRRFYLHLMGGSNCRHIDIFPVWFPFKSFQYLQEVNLADIVSHGNKFVICKSHVLGQLKTVFMCSPPLLRPASLEVWWDLNQLF